MPAVSVLRRLIAQSGNDFALAANLEQMRIDIVRHSPRQRQALIPNGLDLIAHGIDCFFQLRSRLIVIPAEFFVAVRFEHFVNRFGDGQFFRVQFGHIVGIGHVQI